MMDGSAFVTGGSSGIGLEAALQLARRYRRVAIFARDRGRLDAAVARIAAGSPGCEVRGFVLDVADEDAVQVAVGQAVAELGPPDRVVLSAGILRYGESCALDSAAHRAVMDVNYFGCLWMVRALVPHLRRGAAIGLVGSASGIVGIYGYAAYAPSKFALRGLAEILRVELGGRGITVTLSMPPDTDTPMLAAEEKVRSPVTRRMAAGASCMAAGAVAGNLLRAMDRGRFLALPNFQVRAMWWLAPPLQRILMVQERWLLRRYGSAQVFADDVHEHGRDGPEHEGDRRNQNKGQGDAGVDG